MPLGEAPAQQAGGGHLAHQALHFSGGILPLGAMSGDGAQFRFRIRTRAAGGGRLEQSLRHQVGVAAIGRGGMGIIVLGQSKVPFVFGAGRFHNVFAGAEQFYHGERKVLKMTGVGSLALIQKSRQRARVGRGGKLETELRAMAWCARALRSNGVVVTTPF